MKDKIYTIFGEEHFIPPQTITLYQRIENHIIDKTYKASLNLSVQIDKEKLEKWLKLCLQLEQIEQSDLIDFATKKRFNDLVEENEQLRKENEELKSYNFELHQVRKALSNQIQCENKKLAVEKLEQLLKFILNSKWTNIELCVSHSPLQIIRNKINEMVNELKGE